MKLIIRETWEEFRLFSGKSNCCLGKWKLLLVLPVKFNIQIARYYTHTIMWTADSRLSLRNTDIPKMYIILLTNITPNKLNLKYAEKWNTEKEGPLLCKAADLVVQHHGKLHSSLESPQCIFHNPPGFDRDTCAQRQTYFQGVGVN